MQLMIAITKVIDKYKGELEKPINKEEDEEFSEEYKSGNVNIWLVK